MSHLRTIAVLLAIVLVAAALVASLEQVWAQPGPAVGESAFAVYLPLIIGSGGSNPLPSPTASPTEATSSTPTQTPSPTSTATQTATPTPTSTQSATATSTATPTETREQLPPDPGTVAPPLDQTGGTSLLDATAFLYTGANPIQTGVVSGTIAAAANGGAARQGADPGWRRLARRAHHACSAIPSSARRSAAPTACSTWRSTAAASSRCATRRRASLPSSARWTRRGATMRGCPKWS